MGCHFFSPDPPDPRSNLHLLFSCIVGGFFTHWSIVVCTCSQIIVVSVSQKFISVLYNGQTYNSSGLMWCFCGVVKLGSFHLLLCCLQHFVLHSIPASGQGTMGVQGSAFCRHVLEITHSTSAHISLAKASDASCLTSRAAGRYHPAVCSKQKRNIHDHPND